MTIPVNNTPTQYQELQIIDPKEAVDAIACDVEYVRSLLSVMTEGFDDILGEMRSGHPVEFVLSNIKQLATRGLNISYLATDISVRAGERAVGRWA